MAKPTGKSTVIVRLYPETVAFLRGDGSISVAERAEQMLGVVTALGVKVEKLQNIIWELENKQKQPPSPKRAVTTLQTVPLVPQSVEQTETPENFDPSEWDD